ncbi:hypothetical protein HAX54_039295 [Datura stramonium]|uniref:EF-hand domain-containing protein n=1 Tax=Datura stramonium TaxID=4076 RepID=A0ABS8VME6_DATST|nr:hypothetical protein [Datura stramonium]
MEFDTSPINRCSKEHEKIYQQWFSLADSDGDGRLTGGDAIKFFAMSNSASWQDLKQLVSLAQAGHPVSSDLLNVEGIDTQNFLILGTAVDFENSVTPTLEGLDLLQAKKKRMPKSEPAQNGNPTVPSVTANWFSSPTSVKKLPVDACAPYLSIGAHIGPEPLPTTDRFVVVMNGPDERSIPGNTIAVQANMPFSELSLKSPDSEQLLSSHLAVGAHHICGYSWSSIRLKQRNTKELVILLGGRLGSKGNTHLPAGDFPNVEHFREVLRGYNIDKFEKLKPKLIQSVDDMLKL